MARVPPGVVAVLLAGCLLSPSAHSPAPASQNGAGHTIVATADVRWTTLRPGAEINYVKPADDPARTGRK